MKTSFGRFLPEPEVRGIGEHMTESIKKVIILGNREEKQEISKICSVWETFFKKREWETEAYFIGTDAEQTLIKIAADEQADMVVCFHLAGFHVTMFGGDIFLNKLCCPIVNIIWKPLEERDLRLLDSRLNVTIVFFTNHRENVDKVQKCLEFPPYIQYIPDFNRFWEEGDLETVLLYGNDREQ